MTPERPPFLGQPFLHVLGSPRRRVVLILVGAVGATRVFLTPVTGGTESGWFAVAAWAVLVAVLPLLVAVDVAIHVLPNRLLYPTGALCGALLMLDWVTGGLSGEVLVRCLATAVTLFAATFALYLWVPAGGYGLGDVRMVTVAGLVLASHSWPLAVVALLVLPPLVAVVPALVLASARRDTRIGVAFGPYLALGAALAAFTPQTLLGPLGL